MGRLNGVPIDVGFDSILENFDLAAMVHFEAFRDNQWGIIIDYGFMDLGSKLSNSRGGILDADVRQGVLESFNNHLYCYEIINRRKQSERR